MLQKAGVMHAGAKGFVDWLEGIADFFDGGPRATRVRGIADSAAGNRLEPLVHDEDIDPQRCGCSKYPVMGDPLDRERERIALDERTRLLRALRQRRHISESFLVETGAAIGATGARRPDRRGVARSHRVTRKSPRA